MGTELCTDWAAWDWLNMVSEASWALSLVLPVQPATPVWKLRAASAASPVQELSVAWDAVLSVLLTLTRALLMLFHDWPLCPTWSAERSC